MTLYEKNLKALAELYPDYDKLVAKALDEIEEKILIEEFCFEDGVRRTIVYKDEKKYYMHGKREPLLPAKKWYESLGNLQQQAPIIMLGVANSSYLKEVAENTQNQLTIVVYEPSLKIFVDFLQHEDITSWVKKHTIVFWVKGLEGMTEDRFSGFMHSLLTYEIIPLSRTFVSPNYVELFPDDTYFFVKACHDAAEFHAVQFNTKRSFSSVFAKNLFQNVTMLCDGYKTTQLLDVVPKDIPGIVVAAGPSLNKNIRELKKAKGKAFIVAVDTAIKPLLKEGIIPDMFAIVDGEKPVELINDERVKKIPLVTTLNAASDVLKYHSGMKFFANEGMAFVERILQKYERQYGSAADGGSVATAIFTLMYKIGLTRIILVGQDLALTDNKTHADGTFEEIMPTLDTSNDIMVEGNVVDKIPTRQDFLVYLHWYNNIIEKIKKDEPDFRIINATEGGAKIKGTEVMTLREAIEKECTKSVNIQERFEKLQPMFSGEDRDWVIGQIKTIPKDYQKIIEDAEKTISLYKKLDEICKKKKLDNTAYVKILKKINNSIKKIQNNIMYQTIILTMNEAEYILKNEQYIQYDSEIEQGKEMARQGLIFMNGVKECARIYKEYSQEVIDNWNP